MDPGFFRPSRTPRPATSALRLLAVSWLRWLKGYEYAVVAVRRLLDRGVPVTLAILGGDRFVPDAESAELRRLRFTIDDLGLADHVVLAGPASSRQVRTRLRESDAFLHPSLAEGIPTVVLEAMACEVPVVVADAGGVREAVEDGREGFVVPRRDPDALAGAVERLWRDPSLRASMGRAGRERVLADFGLERQVESFISFYGELVRAA